MKLNDATILNKKLNGKVFANTLEFIHALFDARDLVADVYVNGHLALTTPIHLVEDNGYMLSFVDGRFALSESVPVADMSIQIRQSKLEASSDNIIIESFTDDLDRKGIMIESSDCDADLCFKVTNTTPNCTTKCMLPDSKFRSMGSSNITPIDLDSAPEDPINTITP